MPGVWLSSTIMSTDAVLLPAWAASLYFLWRFRERAHDSPTARWPARRIGLAMLGKYAALYLFVGAGLAALFDRDMRKALLSPGGAAVVVVRAGGALAQPDLERRQRLRHREPHRRQRQSLAKPASTRCTSIGFIGDQMAVFGPITLLVLFAGFAFIVGRKDKDTTTRELWLLCFIVPPLVVILGQEIMSRAHANWAATAYPAACVLLASWIGRAFGGETGRHQGRPVHQDRRRSQRR